jgi:transposase InsO family protein
MRKVRDFLRRFQGISVSANSVRKTLNEAGIPPLPGPSKRRRRKPMPPRRFERAEPNQLWQSDITSFLLTRHSTRVYLTVFLDDCSRYVVSWALSTHQRQELVTECLMEGIARFGKPKEVLTDQGRQYFAWRGKSDYERLLDREGIEHVVSRTHHPETLGKCERLWDTINSELWERTRPQDLNEARERLSHWFAHYNHFRPHQGIDGLVPADRFFKAEDQVRAALESHMASSEIALALGQSAKKPVFLFGLFGDHAVSLLGVNGRLVMQTSDGMRREVGLEEIGTPHGGEKAGDERADRNAAASSGASEAQADTALQEACALPSAHTDRAGEGTVGVGERGGARTGTPHVRADDRVLAGPEDEVRDGGDLGSAALARVAVESVGAVGHARGPLEATPNTPEGSGRIDLHDERAVGAAQGERQAEEGARAQDDRARALEGLAAESRSDRDDERSGRESEGGKKAADQGSTGRAERSWGSGFLSEDDYHAECWRAWLERST